MTSSQIAATLKVWRVHSLETKTPEAALHVEIILAGYEIALQLALANERASVPAMKSSSLTLVCTDCHQRKPFTEWVALPRGELRCPTCLNGRPIVAAES